jgi:hypothetical protein
MTAYQEVNLRQRISPVIEAIVGRVGVSIGVAVAIALLLSGCGEYDHIPMAGQPNTYAKTDTVQVVLQWNPVPGAYAYNVYWRRFPGVTKHTGHKIPAAANPITITDLEPDTTYYFVVTAVGDGGESKESKEMAFAGMGATGLLDFKNLFEQPSALPPAGTVKPEDAQPVIPSTDAAGQKAPSRARTQATIAWDNIPGATSYNIYWRSQPGVTKRNGQKIANVDNPHTLKDLVPGKTYYLVVTAVSPSGESSVSKEISFTAK